MPTADDARPDRSTETHKTQNKKRVTQKEQAMTDVDDRIGTADQTEPRLFAFTIDANTAQIVKLESLDATGNRHELTEEEKANLATEMREDRLEDVVERAFEAGIACVLDSAGAQDEMGESAEETELRHMLLTPLIERSAAKHLMEREVLNRAILDTLIGHSTSAHAAAAADSSTTTM